MMRAHVIGGVVFAAALSAGCAPTFEADGSLSVDGAPFQPTTCHVLIGSSGGVELLGAKGDRLVLALPPRRLDAWQEIKGAPRVRLTRAGKSMIDLGTCGSLTLRGEGYHGQGKRAASGQLSLSCAGAATVKGEMTLSGCF